MQESLLSNNSWSSPKMIFQNDYIQRSSLVWTLSIVGLINSLLMMNLVSYEIIAADNRLLQSATTVATTVVLVVLAAIAARSFSTHPGTVIIVFCCIFF